MHDNDFVLRRWSGVLAPLGSVGTLAAVAVGTWQTTKSWAITVAVAAAVCGLSIPFLWYVKRSQKVRIFLSMQVSELTEEEYVSLREEIMRVVYDLRSTDRGASAPGQSIGGLPASASS